MSVWGEGFRRTLEEYEGNPLVPRSCVSCGKDLITGEVSVFIKDYGLICVDCEDYIDEEESVWDY